MYLKSFLEAYKDQDYFINNDIKTYYTIFKLISANLEIQNMLNNYIKYC